MLDVARSPTVPGASDNATGVAAVKGRGGAAAAQRYRAQDLAWADRGAARAGLPRARRFTVGGWTDPVLALMAGLPTISLVSVRGGGFTNYHLPTDTPDRVAAAWSAPAQP